MIFVSACRTRGGKTAAKNHTPRFLLVPALREELEIPVPADRLPGRAWKQGTALAVVPSPRTERPVRIGYARTSTARRELASQLEALRRSDCRKVFQEQISTRLKVRPELEKALAPAHQFKEATPETPVIPRRKPALKTWASATRTRARTPRAAPGLQPLP